MTRCRIPVFRLTFLFFMMAISYYASSSDFSYQLKSDLRSYSYAGDRYTKSKDFELHADNYMQLMINYSSNYKNGSVSFPMKVRASSKYSFDKSDKDSNILIDEALLDYTISNTLIFNLGRKQIANGVAMGYNPTDILNINKYQDRHLADQSRREEIKGDDVIGLINFFSSSSLTYYYFLKENSSWFQYAFNYPSLNTDLNLSYYHKDMDFVGLNISTTLNDNVTGYIESSFSNKRTRLTFDKNGIEKHDSGFFTDLVVGGQYTFNDGTNINMEYWYNQNSYTKNEYNIINELIINKEHEREKYIQIKNQRNRYKNKLFLRVSDIPVIEKVNFEQTAIYGILDNSFFLRSSIINQYSSNSTIRTSFELYHGNKGSEYGDNPINYGLFVSFQCFWDN